MTEILNQIQGLLQSLCLSFDSYVWMGQIITAVLFIIGFVILVKGAVFLTDGASSIARLFSVSEWIIGVVIIGLGTSLPELAVTLTSAIKGTDTGVGTIVGSNTFNTLFILGIVALISPIVISKSKIFKDLIINIGAVLVIMAFAFFPIFGPSTFYGFSSLEGSIIFILFVTWLIYLISRMKGGEEESEHKKYSIYTSILMMVGGFVGVFLGSKWVVDGATSIAQAFGISEALIGVAIIGIGTSLPEVAVSVTSALKGNTELAIGNVVGSNIFNFIGILGIASLFNPMVFPTELRLDIFITLFSSILLLILLYKRDHFRLGRIEGIILLFFYVIYFSFLVVRAL